MLRSVKGAAADNEHPRGVSRRSKAKIHYVGATTGKPIKN
jgi:hypothetical protein